MLVMAYVKFLDLLKMHAAIMRKPGCSSIEIINKRLECNHDVKVTMI